MDRDTRTAVVIVHGMGEQRPLDTINGFMKTGLEPIADPKRPNGQVRIYYSRPAHLTKSYEARRLLAIERRSAGAVVQTPAMVHADDVLNVVGNSTVERVGNRPGHTSGSPAAGRHSFTLLIRLIRGRRFVIGLRLVTRSSTENYCG